MFIGGHDAVSEILRVGDTEDYMAGIGAAFQVVHKPVKLFDRIIVVHLNGDVRRVPIVNDLIANTEFEEQDVGINEDSVGSYTRPFDQS